MIFEVIWASLFKSGKIIKAVVHMYGIDSFSHFQIQADAAVLI